MDRTVPGKAKGGDRRERGGQRGLETKRRLLVEDVSVYREFYEGVGCRLGLAPITFGTEETGDWTQS